MAGQRGQSTVEWTGLLLLVAAVLGATATAARSPGDAGLPQRVACAIAGGECDSERVFFAAGFDRLRGTRATVGTRTKGSTGLLAGAGTIVPAAGFVEATGDFVWRNRRTVRKVAVTTAIATGVGATCAAAVVTASALGAVGCGSAIVVGGFAVYDQVRR
jgi:hypothetical protein